MKKVYILTFLLFANLFLSSAQTQIGQTLTEFENSDGFGTSVAINDFGNRILTSAPFFNSNGVNFSGRANAYFFDGTEWVQLGATLEGPSIVSGQFGRGLDMSPSGNRIVLGNVNAKSQVYEWNETIEDWEQMGDDLEFPNHPNAFLFSFRFAQNENILVVGAVGAGPDSIYQFQWDGDNWNAVGNPLEVPVKNELAISDNAQTVAALFRDNEGINGIRIYNFDGTNWNLQFTRTFPATLIASDGFDLSADGTRLVLSYVNDSASNLDGTFETYDLINGAWIKTLSDLVILGMENNNNALRLSADGGIFVFGAGQESTTTENSGTFVYQEIENTWALLNHFDYENYDEGILGNVDITPDGSKVIFGRSTFGEVGFVEVYDITELLGIDDFGTSNYKIYPNPTTGYFSVDAHNEEEILEMFISDVTGKTIQEISFSSRNSIEDYYFTIEGNSGLYFVTLISVKGKITFKILKK